MKNPQVNNKIKKVFKWILRVLLVQLILINISAAFHAHRITHFYDDDRVRNLPSSSGKFFLRTWRLMVGRKFPKSQIVFYPPGPYDSVQLFTASKNKIDGWWMKADSAVGTVILFHGLSSNKGFALNEAYEFLSMGYNTLLIDFRAHGNSSGTACTIGMREAEEVKLAYDYVKTKGENNIILWGMSMGAVSITRAVYEYNISPQKVILEMPFERLQDHIRARARVFGFPDEPFGFFVTFWAGLEQGYWAFGHKTTKYVKSISCPVLLQWGARDEYVLKKETENIFKNISSKKTLVEYHEAGHESLLNADTGKWRNAVAGFLKNP
jgi:alpha-beta hydrolase superfamily lysophospholipase